MEKQHKIWVTEPITERSTEAVDEEDFYDGMEEETPEVYTCTDCDRKDVCEYAFDSYCTGGDCLWLK